MTIPAGVLSARIALGWSLVFLALVLAAPLVAAQDAPPQLTQEEIQRLGYRIDPDERWVESPEVEWVAGYYEDRTYPAQRLALYPTGLVIGCEGACAGTWRLEGNLLFLTPTHPGPRNEWYNQFSGPYYVVQFEPVPGTDTPQLVPGSRAAQRRNSLLLASRVRADLQNGPNDASRPESRHLVGQTFVWRDVR